MFLVYEGGGVNDDAGKRCSRGVKMKQKIIHFADFFDGERGYFACNHAIGKKRMSEGKLTFNWDLVTCKNCLKIRER